MRTAKLTVVGAGPGDEELITLKAIKAIENANVIMYDALINNWNRNHSYDRRYSRGKATQLTRDHRHRRSRRTKSRTRLYKETIH